MDSSQTTTIDQTTDLYYDASGNVIQDNFSTPTQAATVLNQYVWTPVESGMMILRDSNDGSGSSTYGVSGSHLDQRVWAMQAPDGSMMQIVQQHPSNQPMQNYTEEYVYDPSGQASIIRYNVATADYDFWINSVYDWRYLWKGGRSGRDQTPHPGHDPVEYSDYVDVFDGTYMMRDGSVYDSRGGRQSPLQSDKYAFFRPGSGSSDINQYQYGTRSFVNATYGEGGTGSNLDDLKIHNDFLGLEEGFGMLIDPLYRTAQQVGNIGAGAYNAVTHPVQTVTNFANNLGDVYKRANGGLQKLGVGEVDRAFASFGVAALYFGGSLTGATQLAEGLAGWDFASGQELSTEDRWVRGLGGLGNLALLGAGAIEVTSAGSPAGGLRAIPAVAREAEAEAVGSIGFIEGFVGDFVSKQQLDAVRLVTRGHAAFQREGFGGLKFIDTGASVSKYVSTEHGILLEAVEERVTAGLLAEELQHAMDYASGLHSPQKLAAMKRSLGENFNIVWHQQTFTRIADALENDPQSIFHFFLQPADAARFRQAAAALGRRLK